MPTSTMMAEGPTPSSPPASLLNLVPAGVVTPEGLRKLYTRARQVGYEIPAYRCNSSAACNAALEAARQSQCAPVIIRTNYASSINYAGRALSTSPNSDKIKVAVAGAVALALHVRTMAPHYGVPVILQSETLCLHQLSTWYEGLTEANESYYAVYQEPLFSTHRLDLTSDYPTTRTGQEEVIAIASKYLERLDRLKIWLELPFLSVPSQKAPILLGCRPEDSSCAENLPLPLDQAYKSLSQIGNGFSLFYCLNASPCYNINDMPPRKISLDEQTREQ